MKPPQGTLRSRRFGTLTVCSAAAVLVAVLAPGTARAQAPAHGRLLAVVQPPAHRAAGPVTMAAPLRSPTPTANPAPAAVAAPAGDPACTPTPQGSRERRIGGVAFCVREATSEAATAATTAATGAATTTAAGAATTAAGGAGPTAAAGVVTPMVSSLCAATPVGTINYNRFESCRKMLLTGTLVNEKGVPLGTSTLSVQHSVTLRATATVFDDQVSVTLTAVTGEVNQVAIGLDAACGGLCTATTPSPWTGTRLLSRGQSAAGTVAFATALAKGAQYLTRIQYHAYITVPGAIPLQPNANWDGVIDIRCDAVVGALAGCVHPKWHPELELSFGTYGAAAVTYYWAQEALPDGWGFINPLHRLADDALAAANRARTCDSTFTTTSVVVNDSCDEFPFAKTYEGGAEGRSCADIIPLLEGGQWHLYEADPDKPVTMLESCVRGHVPLSQNEGAGGELGRFTQAQRVLDYDAYLLYFVN